jgi:hypothetical protein
MVAGAVPVIGPAPQAHAATISTNASAAVAYADRHGMSSGIAVLDIQTGRLFAAGHANRYYSSASVVKTLIATRLLVTQRMSGTNAALAWKMITKSDNAAAWTLYAKVGRDTLLPWIAAQYRISGLGARPTMPGIWGSTQITARGMVRFYAAVRKDRTVWPWLGRAMHAYSRYSGAGEPNAWGIAVAVPSAALKNGWATNRDVHAPSNANINSTAVVQGDRFAVAILSEGPSRQYYAGGEAIVTREAQLLMPGGQLVPPPAITGISPSSGRTAGGTRVTIAGAGFSRVTAVTFGSAHASRITWLSASQLVVTSPPHAAGSVDVHVLTSHGPSPGTVRDRFTYVAQPAITAVSPGAGATSGGDVVTITGARLLHVTSVRFGAGSGTSITVLSATKLQVTAPAHAAGRVDVRIVGRYGTSAITSADTYRYVSPPAITGISPDAGPGSGGTAVVISGTGFSNATAVTFDGIAGTGLAVHSDTSLDITAPRIPPDRSTSASPPRSDRRRWPQPTNTPTPAPHHLRLASPPLVNLGAAWTTEATGDTVSPCVSSPASMRNSLRWNPPASTGTWPASPSSTPLPAAVGSTWPVCSSCSNSGCRSSRRCAGASPRCRSIWTTPIGSTTRTSIWSSTSGRSPCRRPEARPSSLIRWPGSSPGRWIGPVPCGSCT